jgi:hypothetical protein
MKIHIDEQTTEVEAGRISVIFSIIEDKPMENPETIPVVPTDPTAPVATPTDGSAPAATDAGVQAPATEPAVETGEVNG